MEGTLDRALLALPILLPLATAIVLSFLGEQPRWRAFVVWVSYGILVADVFWLTRLSLVRAQQGAPLPAVAMGSWPPPYGIVLAGDPLSCLVLAIFVLLMGGGLLQASLRLPEQEARWFFHPLFQILAMGIHGALLTGDLFNLYVFFEIFLMASYGLVVFGNREFQLRETVKFFLLNFLTSTLLVVGVAWIYGNYGTLNMEHLMRLSQGADTAMLRVVALLLALTFGMKAAIVPAARVEPPPR